MEVSELKRCVVVCLKDPLLGWVDHEKTFRWPLAMPTVAKNVVQ